MRWRNPVRAEQGERVKDLKAEPTGVVGCYAGSDVGS
jgi:hypothetical protein